MENLKITTFKEDVGKLLLDLGKLVFGGIVLGSLLQGGYPQKVLLISGLVTAIVFCVWGLLFVNKRYMLMK